MLNPTNLPQHIAIIMDGNGRWANKRGLPRIMGHRAGVKTVERITKACNELGIRALTLYAFSTENWKRPKEEVDALMNMLNEYLRKNLDELKKHNVQLRTIGKIDQLPEFVKHQLKKTIQETKQNKGPILTLALNYGSRDEIIQATKKIAGKVKKGSLDIKDINEKTFSEFLYTKDLPDPDLLIRTSGENRISNFLLWQLSYAELYVTDKLWPDFERQDLERAIEDFQTRQRRFGGL